MPLHPATWVPKTLTRQALSRERHTSPSPSRSQKKTIRRVGGRDKGPRVQKGRRKPLMSTPETQETRGSLGTFISTAVWEQGPVLAGCREKSFHCSVSRSTLKPLTPHLPQYHYTTVAGAASSEHQSTKGRSESLGGRASRQRCMGRSCSGASHSEQYSSSSLSSRTGY